MAQPVTDNSHIASQYEQWVYPSPIMDLSTPEVRQTKRDGGDPDLHFYTYWPDQAFRTDLDILVAGCGSNAAARYAFNHPQARITGIDLSASSLAHEHYLQAKHQLHNLSLHQMRLEDIASLGTAFDFIDVCGVLHHLPDPVAGLQALGSVLRPAGTIAVMVYGQYGRTGVYMLQEMFRLMGLGQSAEDVATVKQTLATLPKHHVVQDYAARTRDTTFDAGLVDTFLHRQDRAYTVAGCLEFVAATGLRFMGWWDNLLYYPDGQLNLNHPYFSKVNAMPEPSIWQFMELYNGTLGQHCFCVCRPDRPERSYRIRFDGYALLDYIPVLRCQQVEPEARLPEGAIAIQRRPYPVYTLGPAAAALFRQIDGKKSIHDCYKAAGLTAQDPACLCRAVFRHIWRLSNIFLRLP